MIEIPRCSFTPRRISTGFSPPVAFPLLMQAWKLGPALAAAAGRHVLYGEPTIDADLRSWAREWMAPDVPVGADDLRLTLTSGAVDAIERLLAQAMAKRPEARPASAIDFARALQTIEQEQRLPRTQIVVLDEQGNVIHSQLVPEIKQEPDYEAAIAAL